MGRDDFVAMVLAGTYIIEVHCTALADCLKRSEAIHLICYASQFSICKREIIHLSSNPFGFFSAQMVNSLEQGLSHCVFKQSLEEWFWLGSFKSMITPPNNPTHRKINKLAPNQGSAGSSQE